MLKYTTRLYGPPYGHDDGERGEDTTAPKHMAVSVLRPGQTMDCFHLRDEAQTTAVRRFRHGPGGVYEVIL